MPYLFGFGIGLVAAIALGAVVEFSLVRRFAKASRLVLTVATIGITQLLAVLALLVPRMWGETAASQRIPPPFDWKLTVGTFILTANDLIALIVAPIAMVAVALFLGRTRLGTAVRGAAEQSERAQMLGIPVAWLSTLVWAIAAGLSFLALFLRAGIIGVPIGSALSIVALVQALAALVIGRLRHLPTVATTAVALGILEYGVAWNAESPLLVTPIVGAAVLIALLLQRRQYSRADTDEAASWRLSDEVRPLEPWVTRLPLVRLMRVARRRADRRRARRHPGASCAPTRSSRPPRSCVYAIIGLSLVVLTGWAGQISLGQMGFVAIGAAVAAKCTSEWNVDLTLALLAGGAAGAFAAFVVGLPALRLRGLYLAVTTLVFALAVSSWLLNDLFFDWVPRKRLERLPLFGRIDISTPTRYYVFTLVVFGLVYIALRGVRHSRPGRAIVGPARERARRAGLRRVARAGEADGVHHLRCRRRYRRRAVRAPQPELRPRELRPGPEPERVHRRRGRRPRIAVRWCARRGLPAWHRNGSSPNRRGSSCRRRSACCSSCSSCRAAWPAS